MGYLWPTLYGLSRSADRLAAGAGPELFDVELIVCRDEDQSRVRISELGIGVAQSSNELMLLRIEASTGQMEHYRVAPLRLRQKPPPAGAATRSIPWRLWEFALRNGP